MKRLPLKYFDAGILNVYLARADRYEVTMGFYGGEIALRLGDGEKFSEAESIYVRFAFRQRKNNELALAVFAPDLDGKTGLSERKKWSCFEISEDEFEGVKDPGFEEWVHVYLEGNWPRSPSPIHEVEKRFLAINAITNVLIGKKLFKVERRDLERLVYPLANTTHAYEDAHRELYRYTIDALSKDALKDLNARLSSPVPKLDEMRATRALKHMFPSLQHTLVSVFETISAARGKSTHEKRAEPQPFPAYETFLRDLGKLSKGLEQLLCLLESSLGLGRNKAQALEDLPLHECTNYKMCEEIYGKKITDIGHYILGMGVPKRDAIRLTLDNTTNKYILASGDVSQFLASGRTDDLSIEFAIQDSVGEAIVDDQYLALLASQGSLFKIRGKRIKGCRLCRITEDAEVLPKRYLLFIDLDDGSSLVLEATWNLGSEVRGGQVPAELRKRVHLQYIPHWIPCW